MSDGRIVDLACGDGGLATRELIEDVFLPRIGNEKLRSGGDSSLVSAGEKIWMTTDSFVVSPPQFPGGDIGKLSIYGTVNDLAVAGARPLHLSAGFVLEEGLSLDLLEAVVQSMGEAARELGVEIVAADTKVVERGFGGGIYINTTGVGATMGAIRLGTDRIRAGDALILTGPVGDHGVAIMATRAGLSFDTRVRSDCAPLWPLTGRLLEGLGDGLRFMRDPTRGGIATALDEVARGTGRDLLLEEMALPVRTGVRAATEMLGLDPLYLACEGQALLVVEESMSARALEIIASTEGPWEPAVVGSVGEEGGAVRLRTPLGGTRRLGPLRGDPLPRIC